MDSQFREILVESSSGKLLCALINGERGWLMFLREAGDAGFSSRNPDYKGDPKEMVEYRLNNGQVDEYPRAWAYPVQIIEQAITYFRETDSPPQFIQWHNDSGDGRPIAPKAPLYPGRSGRVYE